jgi:hypothetical protein
MQQSTALNVHIAIHGASAPTVLHGTGYASATNMVTFLQNKATHDPDLCRTGMTRLHHGAGKYSQTSTCHPAAACCGTRPLQIERQSARHAGHDRSRWSASERWSASKCRASILCVNSVRRHCNILERNLVARTKYQWKQIAALERKYPRAQHKMYQWLSLTHWKRAI